jgi:hypothetical protein
MSDTPRKEQAEEQSAQVEQAVDEIVDLPDPAVTDQDAQAVKGGLARFDDESPKETLR